MRLSRDRTARSVVVLFTAALALGACGLDLADDEQGLLDAAAGAASSSSGTDTGNPSDAVDPDDDDAAAASGQQLALPESHAFRIKAGKHHASTGGPRALHLGVHVNRTLSFRALFTGDVPYLTSDPSNQSDWNKLMGISTNRIHHNSIRLGWAWNPRTQLVDLGYYGYLNGTRTMPKIASVGLNQWVNVELHLDNDSMSVTVNGQTTEVRQPLGLSSSIPTSTWVLDTAYFGGQERAPHELHVQVDSISE